MARTSQPHRFPAAAAICLLALATAGAAQDLALTSFDPLNTSRLPRACKAAYEAPLAGCRRSDFISDATCSADCVRGILEMQENIQANCAGVMMPIDTLLSQALQGNLVRVLCPGAENPPAEETPAESTPSPIFQTTTRQTPPTTLTSSTTLRPPTTTTSSQQEEFVTTTATAIVTFSSQSTFVQPTFTASIPSADFGPSPTQNGGGAETPAAGSNNNDDGQGFQAGPGGNDILNPNSWGSTTLPRLDLAVVVAAATYYLIW